MAHITARGRCEKQDISNSGGGDHDAYIKTVWILLENGADVTAQDDTLPTPLHLASSWGCPEILRILIEHGADVNALDGNRNMPLHLALVAVSVKTS